MNHLSELQQKQIVDSALRYIGHPYSKAFNCKHFVQAVYREVDLPYPPLNENLTVEQLSRPPVGHILYLAHKDPATRRGRRSTHLAIILDELRCIHNSYFFGKQVVITPLVELFQLYDIAVPGRSENKLSQG